MPTNLQAAADRRQSNNPDSGSNPRLSESKGSAFQSNDVSLPNDRFVAGFAELLGQFGPHELDFHQPGILRLLNDCLDRADATYGPLEADSAVVVLQRVAGLLARSWR